MNEILELRVNLDYAHLLFKEDEGKKLGTSIKLIGITKDDERYRKIAALQLDIREKYNSSFFFGWEIIRKYTSKELESSDFFQFLIPKVFEPSGEECNTIFDESKACNICGANREQVGALFLKKGTIPKKKDVSITIASEVVVSKRFVECVEKYNLKGIEFKPIMYKNGVSEYYQIFNSRTIPISDKTLVGVTPFDLSDRCDAFDRYGNLESEIYKCPNGDTIGLNLLSELFLEEDLKLKDYDFFESKQKIGVMRGLLVPAPVYICSKVFRNMIINEKLTGFKFEIAHVVKQ